MRFDGMTHIYPPKGSDVIDNPTIRHNAIYHGRVLARDGGFTNCYFVGAEPKRSRFSRLFSWLRFTAWWIRRGFLR